MLEIGSLVDGKYRILSKIGQGGMSVVYLAMNEKAGKQWAIKEVRKDGTKDFEVVKQGLIVETDLLKKLRHPNLPSIVDIIDDDDTFLIVMDFVEGRSLGAELDDYGAQLQDDVIDWAKQICDVLIYLHSRKPPIIYRDLKPDNIMLRPDGRVMLIDFGTAREFKERNVADTVCLGTVGYAAPEQFGGQGQTDARTDIYGLGATLFHLVTGQSPSEPPYEMRPICQINPLLSTGLEQIILRCIEKDPNLRYQSCEELLYELENYDKIDILYRNRQKRRLGFFIASVIMSAAMYVSGFALRSAAEQMNNDNYDVLIEEAAKATDESSQISLYTDAVETKPTEKTAYIEMIKVMKEDAEFSVEESEIITALVNENRDILIAESRSDYAEICFELGKLYWYYFDYGSDDLSKRTVAVSWFSDTVDYGGQTFEQYNMAKIYRDIGTFYKNIQTLATEADDSGNYKLLFDNYNSLLKGTDIENESEIVQLELYKNIYSSIELYAAKYRSDGISEESIIAMVDSVSGRINEIETTTDKTDEMKIQAIDEEQSVRTKIEAVYQVNGGGD